MLPCYVILIHLPRSITHCLPGTTVLCLSLLIGLYVSSICCGNRCRGCCLYHWYSVHALVYVSLVISNDTGNNHTLLFMSLVISIIALVYITSITAYAVVCVIGNKCKCFCSCQLVVNAYVVVYIIDKRCLCCCLCYW